MAQRRRDLIDLQQRLRQAHMRRDRGAGVVLKGRRFDQRAHLRRGLRPRQDLGLADQKAAQHALLGPAAQGLLGGLDQRERILTRRDHEACARKGDLPGRLDRGAGGLFRGLEGLARVVDAAELEPQRGVLAVHVFDAPMRYLGGNQLGLRQVRDRVAKARQVARVGTERDGQHQIGRALGLRGGAQPRRCQALFIGQRYLAALLERDAEVVEYPRAHQGVVLHAGRFLQQAASGQVLIHFLKHQGEVVQHRRQIGSVGPAVRNACQGQRLLQCGARLVQAAGATQHDALQVEQLDACAVEPLAAEFGQAARHGLGRRGQLAAHVMHHAARLLCRGALVRRAGKRGQQVDCAFECGATAQGTQGCHGVLRRREGRGGGAGGLPRLRQLAQEARGQRRVECIVRGARCLFEVGRRAFGLLGGEPMLRQRGRRRAARPGLFEL